MNTYGLLENGRIANICQQADTPTVLGTWVKMQAGYGIGDSYSNGVFSKAEVVAPMVQRRISVGSFYDRFKSLKYPILASSDPIVQAIIKDCSVRNYIDLDNPELPVGLDMVIAAGFAIDKQSILTGEITPEELPRV